MKLPKHGKAIISQSKVVGYLLSDSHRDGRSKAAFFRKYGFSTESWEELAEALRHHVADNEVRKIEDSPFGTRYVVEGELSAPNGKMLSIRSVWFMATSESIPWFVTAYPLKRKQR